MSGKDPFPGDSHLRDPLSADELASHRQAHEKLRDAWPTIAGADDLAKGAKKLSKIIATCAALGVAVAWAIQSGFFQ